MEFLSSKYLVPANSSRYFVSEFEASLNPLGVVQIVWDEKNGIVINQEHNSNLIKYDAHYCTSIKSIEGVYEIPLPLHLEEILRHVKPDPKIIEIGCGKGEFVVKLRKLGYDAFGFDPVLSFSNSFLKSKFWDEFDEIGDLYFMRCDLPHIPSPWEFLSRISFSSSSALVLIEFQRLEWIFENSIWYQISHDHVNLFSIQDFEKRFRVISSGTFSNGEWGWVLIDPKLIKEFDEKVPAGYKAKFESLFLERKRFIQKAETFDGTIAIWGAAGKGIVLANELHVIQSKVFAIDMDSDRWGYFLEASGVEVFSPDHAKSFLAKDALILVCNPNHIKQVQSVFGDKYEVSLPGGTWIDE